MSTLGILSFAFSVASHAFALGFDWLLVAGGIVLVLASYGLALSSPAMAAVMRFLGPLARLVGFGLVLVGGMRLYAAFEVDHAIAAYQQQLQAAVAAARLEEQVKADQAVAAAVADERVRAREASQIKEKLVYVRGPSVCPSPAGLLAVGAELLRGDGAGRSGTPDAAGGAHRPLSLAPRVAGSRQP